MTSVFIPSKDLNFSTVEEERRLLLKYCRHRNTSALCLDLSKVVHCDSAGLAFLIEAKRLARTHKTSCKMLGMSNTIQALAQFCGVDKMLLLEDK